MQIVPTVYCVVPVYNRLEVTRRFLEYVNEQDYPAVQVIVIDDGSTDGTGEFLAHATQSNLTVLKGDGNLWWSGAMRLGINYVKGVAMESDYLLMINNDVRIDQNYISTLVSESVNNNHAVIGSSQRDEVSGLLIGSGYHIDYWAMRFIPVDCSDHSIEVDTLPGRGTLFPMLAIIKTGNVNPILFPHFCADMEYTSRVAELGRKIIVSNEANIFTSSVPSDKQVREMGLFIQYFSFKSRTNLLNKILFFSLHGPVLLRMTVVPRLFILSVKYLMRSRDK